MRWDLIDRFEVLQKGRFAKARKTFKGSEDFFAEHIPGQPRVPEPLFLEMIAQAGGVLLGVGCEFSKEVILAKIRDAKFNQACVPPCELVVEAAMLEEREEGGWVRGEVTLAGVVVASADILLAMIDNLNAGTKKIVFNEDFLKHYEIYDVVRKSEALA